MTTRARALAGIAAALALPVAAHAQTAAVLQVAGVPEDSITPALYADQAGLFKRYGLSVALSAASSGSAIASGVAGGAFQIAKSSLVGLITAHAKGIPFVLVAAGGLYAAHAPIVGLLVKYDSPYKTAADLNGKTVAVSALGDLYAVCIKEWMKKNGGNPDSLKLIELPIGAVPEAVAAGRIDAGTVIEPVLQRAIDAKQTRVLAHPFDAVAPSFMYSGWFATAAWTSAHVKETAAFAHAMHDAAAYVNAHEAQTAPLLAKFTAIDAGEIAKMTRVENGSVLDPKLIQPVIDACAAYALIAAPFDARDLIAPALRS
jgi:NitT/TauT family transport system substrate-binding protein